MARILLVGMALLLPGSAALAGEPIPGVDIYLGKIPGGIAVSAPTGSDGAYKFTGLVAGNYDLSVGGQRVQTVTVGANQGISGVLSSEPGGKASITFNGQVGVVPDLPGAPVSTSRSNKKAGIAKGERSPLPTTEGTTTDPRNGVGGTGGGRLAFAGTDDANSALASVSTTRGTAPGPTGGDGKLPGKLRVIRVINNSETDTATVEAINGVGGMGGGRPKAGGAIDGVNADSSNRDHIDQDAQTDIKKRTAVQSGGSGDARTRVSADVSTLRGTASGPDGGSGKLPLRGLAGEPVPGVETTDVSRTRGAAPLPNGGGDKLPGLAGEPIPGVDVELGKNPGGIVASSRTDSQGNFHFENLPAGNYELTLPGLPAQSLNVGADGIAGGNVMRGPDGSMSIFDRWGNRTAASPKGGGSKTAEKPVGFGSGNTMGAGPGGMGPGPMSPSLMSPGAMNPGAMSPGMMGGAMAPGGGAMGGAGMGRP